MEKASELLELLGYQGFIPVPSSVNEFYNPALGPHRTITLMLTPSDLLIQVSTRDIEKTKDVVKLNRVIGKSPMTVSDTVNVIKASRVKTA